MVWVVEGGRCGLGRPACLFVRCHRNPSSSSYPKKHHHHYHRIAKYSHQKLWADMRPKYLQAAGDDEDDE